MPRGIKKSVDTEEVEELEETAEVMETPATFEEFRQSMITLGKTFSDGLEDRSRFLNDAEIKQFDTLCKLYDTLKP